MIRFKPIGVINSMYTPHSGAPRQGILEPETKARIVLLKQYEEALEGLERYDHIWVIYHFDRVKNWDSQVRPPQSNPGQIFGMFATRTPRRPNPVGISLVKLDGIEGCTISIRGIDAFDGTPVLDIKPYLPSVDQVNNSKNKDIETDLGLIEPSDPK